MNKEQLKEALQNKALVKPNTTEERLSKEVESLCDGFSCGTYGLSRPAGDTGEDNDILV
ncbi:MAG: hypothetical protein KGO82_18550 [Bacteroidota bacterium]|nr:hypothetical protein [Bacteroidota bacterium]